MHFPAELRRNLVIGSFVAGLPLLSGFVFYQRNPEAPLTAASPSQSEPEPSNGGFAVRLYHSEPSRPEEDRWLLGSDTDIDVVGIVTSEGALSTSALPPEAEGLTHLALYDWGGFEPRRAMDIIGADGRLWRLELAVSSGPQDVTPDSSASVGTLIQLRVHSVRFGVGQFTAVRIDDADGLLLALDFRLADESSPPELEVQSGAVVSRTTDSCGSFEIRSLRFNRAEQGLAPGHCSRLTIHDLEYRATTLAASFLTDDGRCTDLFSNIAWSVQRLPQET